MHNFIESPICMGKERTKEPHHPTQKPVRVLEHLITIASNPGDVIFDPFMGVGSAGEAALKLGRRFIGMEIEEPYFNAARERLQAQPSEPPRLRVLPQVKKLPEQTGALDKLAA